MPELPEVETTVRGIRSHIENQLILKAVVRQHKLRWPIIANLSDKLAGCQIKDVIRRGKYIILKLISHQHASSCAVIVHLGMSGRLQILKEDTPPGRHDHVDILLHNRSIIRYTDPRRFGAMLWVEGDANTCPQLQALGLEPLNSEFTASYLFHQASNRSIPIKSLIMDNKIVVGIGNIYATESLFSAKIHPAKPAKTITKQQMHVLVEQIKLILQQAILAGGTTLKDFLKSDGKPGYFAIQLQAYGRAGLPCSICQTPFTSMKISQRTTSYCTQCQI